MSSNGDLSYPRPDFDRSSRWHDLCGPWAFQRGSVEVNQDAMLSGAHEYAEEILVPFPWESRRSGVQAHWLEHGWYRRSVEVPDEWGSEHIILHFGGAHYRARVYFNGVQVGDHIGVGPFECNLTDAIDGPTGTLVVRVDAPVDKRAIEHGKQRSIPIDDYDSCAFEPSSGIWQPVWLEPRPATFVRSVRVESSPGLDALVVETEVAGPSRAGSTLRLGVRDGGPSAQVEVDDTGRSRCRLALDGARPWSPEDPFLYIVDADLNSADGHDRVSVPTGLRRIEIAEEEIRINGRRVYLRGVLDQGYWPESGLAPPSVEALGRDLDLARESGYNLVRKHLKLEDPRWLHLADVMGMLVWEEPPSTSRYSQGSLAAFRDAVGAMVHRDANHPSVIVWGLFNEEWGLDWKVAEDPGRQEVVREVAALARSLDSSRPIIDNSGWSHVDTDIVDWHYYERDLGEWAKHVDAIVNDGSPVVPVQLEPCALELKPLKVAQRCSGRRPSLNSEYGAGTTSVDRAWYLKWQTQELRRHDRLSGYVYTELYDIEHELAGLYGFDRQPKDLANLELSEMNAETVLVLDVLPMGPGIDVVSDGGPVLVEVRVSHHGRDRVAGQLLVQWGPHLGARPAGSGLHRSCPGPKLEAEPFVLGPPVPVETRLPSGWHTGRLHLSLQHEGAIIASTSLDVVTSQSGRE